MLIIFASLSCVTLSAFGILLFVAFPVDKTTSEKIALNPAVVKLLFFGSLMTNLFLINWTVLSTPVPVLDNPLVKGALCLTLLSSLLFMMILIARTSEPEKMLEFFHQPQQPEGKRAPEEKSSSYWLPEERVHEIRQAVDKYLEEEKPYLEQGFCVADLAEGVGVPRHQLAACFTQAYDSNFNELINRHRIEYGLNEVEFDEWERFTMEGMAYRLGFGSRSTFSKAFKKTTKMTPSKYRRKMKKQVAAGAAV